MALIFYDLEQWFLHCGLRTSGGKEISSGCNKENFVGASFEISQRITKRDKPPPIVKMIVSTLIGEKTANDLSLMMSNDTVKYGSSQLTLSCSY